MDNKLNISKIIKLVVTKSNGRSATFRFILPILAAVFLLVSGCANNTVQSSLTAPKTTFAQAPTAVISTRATLSNPYFPVQTKRLNGCLDAQIRGQLIIENNFVQVKTVRLAGEPQFSNSPISSLLVIWPYGYSLDTRGTKSQILDDKGRPIAIIGDYIYAVGGSSFGFDPKAAVEAATGQTLPEDLKIDGFNACEFNHPAELSKAIPAYADTDRYISEEV
jgi:hypothetical protein